MSRADFLWLNSSSLVMHPLSTLFIPSTPVLTHHLQRQLPHRGERKALKSCMPLDHTCDHYRVYRSFHRLQGTPVGTPPLHVRINAVPVSKSARTATTFDIVPQFATQPSTLARLLAGHCVPAIVRTRTVSWPLPPRAAARVQRVRSLRSPYFCLACVVHAVRLYQGCTCSPYVSQQPSTNKLRIGPGLSLYTRNCWHFADSVVAVMNKHALCLEDV